jgi:hypothetical protein
MICISSPKLLAMVAERLISLRRSSEQARRRLPTFFQSMAWPVSASRMS